MRIVDYSTENNISRFISNSHLMKKIDKIWYKKICELIENMRIIYKPNQVPKSICDAKNRKLYSADFIYENSFIPYISHFNKDDIYARKEEDIHTYNVFFPNDAMNVFSENVISNIDQDKKKDILVAYTDGSYDTDDDVLHIGSYSVFCDLEDNGDIEFCGIYTDSTNHMTNHVGELMAIICAIKFAIYAGYEKVEIYTDYLNALNLKKKIYAKNSIDFVEEIRKLKSKSTRWINIQYIAFLMIAEQFIDIEINHVKGHTDNIGNDFADELAKTAISTYFDSILAQKKNSFAQSFSYSLPYVVKRNLLIDYYKYKREEVISQKEEKDIRFVCNQISIDYYEIGNKYKDTISKLYSNLSFDCDEWRVSIGLLEDYPLNVIRQKTNMGKNKFTRIKGDLYQKMNIARGKKRTPQTLKSKLERYINSYVD